MTWLKFYLSYLALSSLTGSPLLALALVLGGAWLLDRFTLRLGPRALRWLGQWQREGQLRRTLLQNPHDRAARLELGRLLVARGRHAQAMALVRPNVDAGDDDVETLFVLGSACLGAGYDPQGEALLDAVLAQDPDFRLGEVDLLRGRVRLERGDLKGAREALEALVAHRPGTVQGKVLLAEVLRRQGEAAASAQLREEAWRDYAAAPSFRRREERLWAWRARPSRPALYAALLALGLLVSTQLVLPRLEAFAREAEAASAREDAEPSMDPYAGDPAYATDGSD